MNRRAASGRGITTGPFGVQHTVLENLIGDRSGDVWKTCADKHEVINGTNHCHYGNDDASAGCAYENHTLDVSQGFGDVF
jgi:hypothetical protein